MASEASRSDRVISHCGALNLRDLGGLRTVDGQRVRRGRVYRSDCPRTPTADSSLARDLSLLTVVDLRHRAEVDFECVRWAEHGVEHVVCSFSAGGTSSWHAAYEAYLQHRPERVVTAVRQVLAPARHPVLFHCAAGKDRTGVLAALLLCVLGVTEEGIVADYLLTEHALAPVLARLRSSEPYAAMLAATDDDAHRPQPATMRSFLAWLDAHGGAEKWLRHHGVPEREITGFRDALLEGSPPSS